MADVCHEYVNGVTCKYCDEYTPFAPSVADVPAFDECEIVIENNMMTVYQGNVECTFIINNCPMCGKKLKANK